MQARRGELIDVLESGMGVLALDPTGALVGIVTWAVDAGDAAVDADGTAAEIRAVAVASAARGGGVGRALLDAAAAALRAAGVRRAWLVTTNDNLAALALYQKAGWRLVAVRPGAIDELRRAIKPSIPELGQHGIRLRDELVLEWP